MPDCTCGAAPAAPKHGPYCDIRIQRDYPGGFAALGRVDVTTHHGPHRCVDGRTYGSSCLVTDPDPVFRDVSACYLARSLTQGRGRGSAPA